MGGRRDRVQSSERNEREESREGKGLRVGGVRLGERGKVQRKMKIRFRVWVFCLHLFPFIFSSNIKYK